MIDFLKAAVLLGLVLATAWNIAGVLMDLLAWWGKNRFQKRQPRFDWSIGVAVNKTKTERKIHMLELKITNEQKIEVALTPITATGKPAELDGPASFTVISGSATVEVLEGGRSAFLVSGDLPGDSEILVEADADLGEGVETISDIIKLSVLGAKAASLGLTAKAAVAK